MIAPKAFAASWRSLPPTDDKAPMHCEPRMLTGPGITLYCAIVSPSCHTDHTASARCASATLTRAPTLSADRRIDLTDILWLAAVHTGQFARPEAEGVTFDDFP